MLALDVIRRLEVPEVTLLLHPQRLCAGQTGLFPRQSEQLRAGLSVAKLLRLLQLIDANVKARSVLFSDEWLEPSRHRLRTRLRSTRWTCRHFSGSGAKETTQRAAQFRRRKAQSCEGRAVH